MFVIRLSVMLTGSRVGSCMEAAEAPASAHGLRGEALAAGLGRLHGACQQLQSQSSACRLYRTTTKCKVVGCAGLHGQHYSMLARQWR